MTRQIVLDTETTGLETSEGHRIIEIGCVELIDRRITSTHYHVYINPEREVDSGAIKVHGITNEFLQDKPTFKQVVEDFLSFVGNSELIIHNAPFDVGFINHELKLYDKSAQLIDKRCAIFDTLTFAREKHRGKKNNLDALCKRYHIDNSNRQLHGALLDAEILAHVYLAMTGGQEELFASQNKIQANLVHESQKRKLEKDFSIPVIMASKDELTEHELYLKNLAKSSATGMSLWEELTHKDED